MEEREKVLKAAEDVEAHKVLKENDQPAVEAEEKAEDETPDVEAHKILKSG